MLAKKRSGRNSTKKSSVVIPITYIIMGEFYTPRFTAFDKKNKSFLLAFSTFSSHSLNITTPVCDACTYIRVLAVFRRQISQTKFLAASLLCALLFVVSAQCRC